LRASTQDTQSEDDEDEEEDEYLYNEDEGDDDEGDDDYQTPVQKRKAKETADSPNKKKRAPDSDVIPPLWK
jgi:hypothetical protein